MEQLAELFNVNHFIISQVLSGGRLLMAATKKDSPLISKV